MTWRRTQIKLPKRYILFGIVENGLSIKKSIKGFGNDRILHYLLEIFRFGDVR
jgi:hypothetical protein